MKNGFVANQRTGAMIQKMRSHDVNGDHLDLFTLDLAESLVKTSIYLAETLEESKRREALRVLRCALAWKVACQGLVA